VDLERQFVVLYGDAKKFPDKCDECGGKGYLECDLGHDHDCEECDGSGDAPDPVEQFMLDEYHDQVEKDKKVFEKYKKEFSHAS
jgi:RecJ-like exonuclease